VGCILGMHGFFKIRDVNHMNCMDAEKGFKVQHSFIQQIMQEGLDS
jgi:hypothetical protein